MRVAGLARKIGMLIALAVAWSGSALAQSAPDPLVVGSNLCLAATAVAERAHATPPNLLATIARVESGRPVHGLLQPWPWAIDTDGHAFYFDTMQAAVAGARAALAGGSKALDIGCMQVDWQQHPGAFPSLEAAFDPGANADYAARFLRALYIGDAGGSWPVAVGMYHSHTPMLAEDYRGRVAQAGADILAGVAGPQSLYQRALRQGTLRMALAGGGMLVLNINRQPVSRRQKPLSACQVAQVLGPYLRSPLRGCLISQK